MKLLILTQYFPPEVGAPQNRLFELALRLKKSGVDITVLTAMPNYPQMEIHEAYKGKKYVKEEMEGMTVHRSSIYVSKEKGIVKRLRNYFSFVKSSYFVGKKLESFDFILCESPPLFLGYSAMRLSKKLKAKLIFNVSDLWPESAEKLGIVTNKMFLKIAYNLEKRCYNRSTLITGQTQGIVKDIETRFPNKDVYWLPNGVDLAYYNPDEIKKGVFRKKMNFSDDDFILFYGGIIGHAQGLDLILNTANELRSNTKLKFILLGSGPEKERLLKLKNDLNLENVFFLDAITKQEMPETVIDIDCPIIPLRKLDLFLGAIPSKVFEALAMKKPILLGVDGEARDLFIKQGNTGLYFEPESVEELVAQITKIQGDKELYDNLAINARTYVDEKFNRNVIAEGFYNKLKEIAD
jgi:glycosyltransferase involved in cell wall biosynthesis